MWFLTLFIGIYFPNEPPLLPRPATEGVPLTLLEKLVEGLARCGVSVSPGLCGRGLPPAARFPEEVPAGA